MGLSRSTLKKFAKITNDRSTKTNVNTYVYATAVVGTDGIKYVKMDGSEYTTPVSRLSDIEDGDRVMVSVQNHVATVIGNLSYPYSQRIANSALETANQSALEVETLKATSITTDTLYAEVAKIGYLTVDEANIAYAKITELDAIKANIEELESKSITTDYLEANYATIVELNATKANIDILDANYANIETLLSGNVSAGSIQSIVLNSSNATIANGTIKSAMIESLAFNKLTGIDINTTNLTIHSEDGKSKWSDNTIQISDANRVRLQIGKDASDDYSMTVWDASGNLIWDALGATENTIQRKIIRNDIVADNAAIAGSKLDIESVVSEINGATTKLKSTTILLDETNQTLDVSFKSLETTVSNNLIEAKTYVDDEINELDIGGKNLIRNSKTLIFEDYYFENVTIDATYDKNGNVTVTGISASYDENGNVTIIGANVTYDNNGNVTLGV